jgi:hypothetical protein
VKDQEMTVHPAAIRHLVQEFETMTITACAGLPPAVVEIAPVRSSPQ